MFVPRSIECLRKYDRPTFFSDLFAGLTVGVVALPLAMAFAIASGVTPEKGIYTAIVAGFLISALGGSRVQIGGPTGAFVVIVSGIITKHGYDGLAVCTIMAGIFLIVMGVARFGGMIKFIPFPVVTGFTSGIALVIFSTQIKDLFGLKIEKVSAEFIEKWTSYIEHFGTISPSATCVGLGTVVVIVIVRRLSPKAPAMLIAMIAATAAAAVLKLDVETIGGRFGDLPRTLPMPRLPGVNMDHLRELVSPALTVALLAAIESLLSATVADGMTGERHKSNMELVAQGIANIAAILFGGIPATGAIARTATSIKSGAKTPVAGMIHAAVLLGVLLVFAPLAKLIPLASLAGILVVVTYNMSEWERFRSILRGPRSDVAVLLTTFILTVLVDLTVAVQVGVVLAAMLFIRHMSEVTNIGIVTRELRDMDSNGDPNAIRDRQVPAGVEVYEINGPFFFGAASKFADTIRFLETPPRAIIIRLRNVPVIDATGLNVLREFHERCKHLKIPLVLSGVHAQLIMVFNQSGFWDELGGDNILGNIDDALDRVCELLGLPAPVRPQRQFVATVSREGNQGSDGGADGSGPAGSA